MAIALVRAAERCRSPAILMLFPVTLAYGKGPFLRFCLDLAHQASVPIAVHLDHATDPEHIELAFSLAEQGVAFDTMMVDASHAETDEENINLARPYVERARKLGIPIEVELGRLEGGEAGLRVISDAKLTDPGKAEAFMNGTSAAILAPSIGNLHGTYLNPPNFRQHILMELWKAFKGRIPLCLHGTDGLPDEIFVQCIRNGVNKINVNSWARDPYAKTLGESLLTKSFPEAQEAATEAFATMSNVVLITGAAGWLGTLLSRGLRDDAKTQNLQLILADIVEPTTTADVESITIKTDMTDELQVEALFNTRLGIPDTVYCLHGIMSRGSEDNFDMGLKVNVDSVRLLLDIIRQKRRPSGCLIKFIFTSSLAVYGGPLPNVINPSTIATPESAYGLGKLTSELFINEYTRRGFIDGRILRLPTIVVRPGPPSMATSAFISGIIREPLQSLEATCPIGDSLDSRALDLPLWLASPQVTITNLVHAKHIPAEKFPPHTRVVCVPGFTATVRDEILALEKVAGKEVLAFLKFKDDPVNRRVVSSWPSKFDNTYALSLGFNVDEGGMESIIRRFQRELVE
ncbi:hypothetical protein C0992_010730 [Termitomyces sp. T32_za158]|nr:hypothetical protein C0992_010730 [Termitomyces sp. T32_za158]